MSAGLLIQEFVDAVREPGEYYDGDATRLELVVSANGRLRQFRVRSGMSVSRSAERVGASSMYSLEQARVRAARILADMADNDPEALARKRAQATAASAAFFNSWTLGLQTPT